VNFIDPPRGISKSVCGESTCPIGAFGGQSLPELSVLTQQGKALPERGICNDVRNKRGMEVWPRGDFYPASPAFSIVAVFSPWSRNLKENRAITVAIVPPINSGRRNPPLARNPPNRDPKGINPQTIVRRVP